MCTQTCCCADRGICSVAVTPAVGWSSMLRACLVTALALAVPSVAVADTTMTLDVKAGSLVSTDTIYVSPAGYRYETAHAVSIFRPQDQVLFDITPAQHSYFRVTSERLRQAAATFDASRHDWGDQLNAMSSERRQRIEAALGPATINSASPLAFTPTEHTATFGKRHCQMLHVMLDHVQHRSVCVVPLSEVGLDDADAQGPEATDPVYDARTASDSRFRIILGSLRHRSRHRQARVSDRDHHGGAEWLVRIHRAHCGAASSTSGRIGPASGADRGDGAAAPG